MKFSKRIIGVVLLLTIILGGVTWAFASGDETIYACVNPSSGEMKIVNSPDGCKNLWVPLSWNKKGPAGPEGPPGVCDEAELQALKDRISELEDLLSHFSKSGNEIYITGANLHVVNGTESTSSINGLGNVIIGYNEVRGDGTDIRSGSHMLVVGTKNNYSSFGGIVTGEYNTSSGWYNFVTGRGNTASEDYASVNGGEGNTASADFSTVNGGLWNTASGNFSTVSGGQLTTCSDWYSWCAGGLHWP